MKINATIALEANDEVLISRLLERGKISGRTDDQDVGKIRNRFEEYNEKTAPLRDYYKAQGKFHVVNGIGSIAEITGRLGKVHRQSIGTSTSPQDLDCQLPLLRFHFFLGQGGWPYGAK